MDWRDLARQQSGAISRGQLAQCDVSESRIAGAIARRELIEALPGVYVPRPVPRSMRQRMWVAALWSGGVISHRSAAALWKLPVERTTTVHVTVADRCYRHPVPGVRVHRVPLGRLDRTLYDQLPITDRCRTVIDLLRTERLPVARTLLDQAMLQSWLAEQDLRRALREGRGRTGNGQLRRLLADLEPGAHAESERRLHRLLRSAGISGWVPQYRVQLANGAAYLDAAFPRQRLAVEVDGRRHHDERSARFEIDRARQNELVALGWRVIRVTWTMLTQHPEHVLAQIRDLLAS